MSRPCIVFFKNEFHTVQITQHTNFTDVIRAVDASPDRVFHLLVNRSYELSPKTIHNSFFHSGNVLLCSITDHLLLRIHLPGITRLDRRSWDLSILPVVADSPYISIFIMGIETTYTNIEIAAHRHVRVLTFPECSSTFIAAQIANDMKTSPSEVFVSPDFGAAMLLGNPPPERVFVVVRTKEGWQAMFAPRAAALEAALALCSQVINHTVAKVLGNLKMQFPQLRDSSDCSPSLQSRLFLIYLNSTRKVISVAADKTVAEIAAELKVHAPYTAWTRPFTSLENGVTWDMIGDGSVLYVTMEPSAKGWRPHVKTLQWVQITPEMQRQPAHGICGSKRYGDWCELIFFTGETTNVDIHHWAINLPVDIQPIMPLTFVKSIVAKKLNLHTGHISLTKSGDDMEVDYTTPHIPPTFVCWVRFMDSVVPIPVPSGVMALPPGEFSTMLIRALGKERVA